MSSLKNGAILSRMKDCIHFLSRIINNPPQYKSREIDAVLGYIDNAYDSGIKNKAAITTFLFKSAYRDTNNTIRYCNPIADTEETIEYMFSIGTLLKINFSKYRK